MKILGVFDEPPEITIGVEHSVSSDRRLRCLSLWPEGMQASRLKLTMTARWYREDSPTTDSDYMQWALYAESKSDRVSTAPV